MNVLLGDSAQVGSDGKVHVLGMGWTRTGVPTGPVAVIVLLVFEATEEANTPHEVVIRLVDSSGELVDLTAAGARSMQFNATIEPRPDEQVELPASAPIVIQFGGMPLQPDETYTWTVTVDGKCDLSWSSTFTTHADVNGSTTNTM